MRIAREGRAWRLTTRGASHTVQVLDPHVAELAVHMIDKVPPDLSRLLLAPMPSISNASRASTWASIAASRVGAQVTSLAIIGS